MEQSKESQAALYSRFKEIEKALEAQKVERK